MSEALIELSNALAAATARAAAHTVAVHASPRGSTSGVVWRAIDDMALFPPTASEHKQGTAGYSRLLSVATWRTAAKSTM